MAGQGHGDHDALAHAAGKVVGELGEPDLGRGEPDAREHRDGAAPGLLLGHALVGQEDLGELAADRVHGVERRHGLLEDHADAAAADALHLHGGQVQEVPALEDDLPSQDLSGRLREQPHQRERGHALAAARLPDKAQGAPGLDREADGVDGAQEPLVGVKTYGEAADAEEGIGHGLVRGMDRVSQSLRIHWR